MATDIATIQEVPAHGGGLALTAANLTAGDDTGMTMLNDGKTLLYVKNGHTASVTITVSAKADPFGRSVDTTLAVTNAEEALLGPFPKNLFAHTSGKISIGQSAGSAAVKYAAVRPVGF